MTKAWNDRKLGVLTDLPASSMGAIILATEANIIAAYPHEGNNSTELPAHIKYEKASRPHGGLGGYVGSLDGATRPPIDGRSDGAPPKLANSPELGRELLSNGPNDGPLLEVNALLVTRPIAIEGWP